MGCLGGCFLGVIHWCFTPQGCHSADAVCARCNNPHYVSTTLGQDYLQFSLTVHVWAVGDKSGMTESCPYYTEGAGITMCVHQRTVQQLEHFFFEHHNETLEIMRSNNEPKFG